MIALPETMYSLEQHKKNIESAYVDAYAKNKK